MNITYLKQSDGSKIFSFHGHDYQAGENGTFIDGGFEYCRCNGETGTDTIENLIEDIRKQFTWTANYEKDGVTLRKEPVKKLLKDLDTDHIINILIYFTERLVPGHVEGIMQNTTQWKAYHLIFLNELKYRYGRTEE